MTSVAPPAIGPRSPTDCPAVVLWGAYTHEKAHMKRGAIWGGLLAAGLALGVAAPAFSQTPSQNVVVISLTGTVDPLSARYVARGLKTGQNEKAAAVLIRIDTPGG